MDPSIRTWSLIVDDDPCICISAGRHRAHFPLLLHPLHNQVNKGLDTIYGTGRRMPKDTIGQREVHKSHKIRAKLEQVSTMIKSASILFFVTFVAWISVVLVEKTMGFHFLLRMQKRKGQRDLRGQLINTAQIMGREGAWCICIRCHLRLHF